MATATSVNESNGLSTTGYSGTSYLAGGFSNYGIFNAKVATNISAVSGVFANGSGTVTSGVAMQVMDITAGTTVATGSAQTVNGTSTAIVLTWSVNFNTVAGHDYAIQFEWSTNSQSSAVYDTSSSYQSDTLATWESTAGGYVLASGGYFRVGVTYTIPNNPPNAPTFPNISSSGGTYNGKPKFFVSVSDPDSGNTITDVEIQISTDSTFASISYVDSYASNNDGSWVGIPTSTNTATTVTFQALPAWGSLPTGTFYMRARAHDNNGVWGNWSATQQFSMLAVPWTDTPSGPRPKAQWLNDIATCIANILGFRVWAYCGFPTLDTTWDITPWHIAARRAILALIATQHNESAPTWTDGVLTPLTTPDQITGGWFSGTTNDVNFWGQQTYNFGISNADIFAGNNAFYITSTYSGGNQYICVYTSNKPVPVSTSGGTYTQEIWFKAPAGRTISVVNYMDTAVGSRTSPTVAATSDTGTITATGTWQRYKDVLTVPSGYPYMEQEIAISNAQNGDELIVGSFACYTGNVFAQDKSGQDIIDLRNAVTSI